MIRYTYNKYKVLETMKYSLLLIFSCLLLASPLRAQEITVTVTPTQPVLPPQLMLYITEPANYFNITLANTGKDNANVYLVMQVEQVNPAGGLSLSTPPRRQPQVPIIVPAGGTRILTPAEVRGLFNHIPLNEINAPADLFDNYTNGSFGLLPEGQYELHFTAYRWDPTLTDPVVASSPTGGVAYFCVCYKAQAPEFLTPMALNGSSELSAAELDPLAPQFTWKAPVIACNPALLQYTYSLRIVELLPGQFPDNSMDHNPVVYQASSLTTPMCMIPQPVIKQMKEGTTYAAQVTAASANANNKMLNYVSIANDGKSTYKLFRLKPTKKTDTDAETDNTDNDDKTDKTDKDDKTGGEDEDDIHLAFGDLKAGGEITDSIYTLTNPKLREPYFRSDGGARKVFETSDIPVVWVRPQFSGGEGTRSDTLQIEYDVELFDNGERADREEAMKTKPVYTFHTKELKDTIRWKDIQENVELGDYLVLRVTPVVKKGESISFTGTDNIIDFALAKRLSKQYFQCEAKVVIEDKEPTSKTAADLKGKVVAIGEYNLTIDDVKGSGTEGFTGTGRVEWQPFGASIMVCVKFEKLKINKDDVVYDGVCQSVAAPEMLSSMQVVDKLFSDWGIDNLIGDTGIPYASQLQGEATDAIKGLAEKVNLGDYYQKVLDGKDITKLLTTGKMDKLYMPIKFPTDVLPKGFDVVDLQIVDMKFAANYATMNILGQSKMPECDILQSKVLVFGAPRVCISPNTFLPEDGHIALLDNFTLTPSTDIELTFKAPKNVLEPHDGCYISWHQGALELLGIDADMKVAGMVKDVNGKATTERPVMNLTASFGSWDDFLVNNISIEDFQLEDLPGWTFRAQDIVYDHSDYRNSDHMGAFPKNYSKEKAGIKGEDEKWHGLHIGSIGVGFPESLHLGEKSAQGDNRLWLEAKEMFIDQSGVTVTMAAEKVFDAKEGTLGGWGISLDRAQLQIIQNDFDNCGFAGQINIPFLDRPKNSKNKDDFGNVEYSCQIRRLNDPHKDKDGNTERTRYSYVFLTEQIDDLDFSFVLGQATLDADQTYFVVEAYDDETEAGKINTQVELCVGGELGIGLIDDANDWLKEKSESLPLELKIPDIHFTKMRLSNVKRSEWTSSDERVEAKRKTREAKELQVHKAALKILMESDELNIGTEKEPFYFDLGEWSLASDTKHLGPFSFNLDKFSPELKDGKLTLEVGGTVGLVEDMINVGASVVISAKVNTPGTDISKWSIENGDVEFRKLDLDLDFTALHLKGELEATREPHKGYKGTLDIGIIGFFDINCEGGYFGHKKDEKVSGDADYSWGYFMASLESALIRIDPVVINRISGGFYFNCKPTPGTTKFNGTPKPQNGCTGIAFGLGLCSSAGEETLSADLDMLVIYDTTNKCMSTFMLNGKLEALTGMIKADCSLIYENEKDYSGNTINRYLCLNVTVEAGLDTNALIEKVKASNAALAALKDKLDEFQAELDPKKIYQQVTNPKSGLQELSGNQEDDDPSIEAGKLEISMEFKVTWVKDRTVYQTPKWHLYVGQPAKDKRCRFTVLKCSSPIISVDIGADGYLCVGNELPDGGALPAIPTQITQFLSGNSNSRADMGADLDKVNRSRKNAAKALLDPNSLDGGVMLGASAWGNISIDLGLLYGSLEAIAGFDVALIHYGNTAFCVDTGTEMGYKGWYAMGQLYAYLAAELGVHVHIGSFINERISILKAGLGGVLELGLPNPTWVEGAARIKVSLLGGLCKIDKKFDFSAGNHCVPYKGNAIDGFEMFQSVSHGSDSMYQALVDPAFAIPLHEAKNMTFITNSSIGSHYRLIDPSWEAELADKDETTEEALEKSIALNASRTYVFDMDQNLDKNNMKMGVRLFDLGTKITEWDAEYQKTHSNKHIPRNTIHSKFYEESSTGFEYKTTFYFLMKERGRTVVETSEIMEGSKKGRFLDVDGTKAWDYYDINRDMLSAKGNPKEIDVSFREEKGSTFHLTGMNLKPGHSYMLMLTADAYEINDGRRVWCQYYLENEKENTRIHWRQQKFWFFRVKSNEEDKVVTDSVRDLEPYVALAYPSYNGTRVRDVRAEGELKAYFNDIMHPTIALNRDITSSLPASKMQWILEGYTVDGDTLRQKQSAKYIRSGNCINLEPNAAFTPFQKFKTAAAGKSDYDFNQERYRLYLAYTYQYKDKKGAQRDSVVYLVNLPLVTLPHDVYVNPKGTFTDSWQVTTNSVESKELLAYSRPFVGACVDSPPTIEYESDYSTKGLTDDNLVFKNTQFSKFEKPYRLIDPYMYFAYLGKWVFIGDREIKEYGFDPVPVKFGSESLIFNYNGTTVNSEFLDVNKNKGESNMSLIDLRKKMYGVWNTWAYNDKTHPKYPLPSTAQTVGGITANNQDGKASTVTPLNVNYYTDYTYVFEDLVKDYTAVYGLADQLCQGLQKETDDLLNVFFTHYHKAMTTSGYKFDSQLNNAIRQKNALNRGRYIEYRDRGYSVRVPYYQLPLIFGACFGSGNQAVSYGTTALGKLDRSIDTSIGNLSSGTGDAASVNLSRRALADASNLLFFRLSGAWDSKAVYFGSTKYPVTLFNDGLRSQYPDSYESAKHVPRDRFDYHLALKAVTGFKCRIYRVDSYDIDKGLYVVSPSGNRCGGGPWEESVTIGTGNKAAANLDQMVSGIEYKDEYLETHYDKSRTQALWCDDTKTLWFNHTNKIYRKGDKLTQSGEGCTGTVTWIYLDEDVFQKNWHISAIYDNCKEVVVRSGITSAGDFKDLSRWFENFSKATSITGVKYLTSPETTDMKYMFAGCERLTELDLKGCYTSKVTSMSHMFDGCKALKSLDLSSFKTEKVLGMTSMFENCEALATVNLTSFTGESLQGTSYMFSGCKALSAIDIRNLGGDKLEISTEKMFAGCTALRKLYIDVFNPHIDLDRDLANMFQGVSSSLTTTYFASLDSRIVKQIPGSKKEMPDNRAKVVHGRYSNGDEALFFVFSSNSYTAGTSCTISIKDEQPKYNSNIRDYTYEDATTDHKITVVASWAGDDVTNTGTSAPKWKSAAAKVKYVYVDKAFAAHPKSTAYWFENFSNLQEVHGMRNLNTDLVTSMKYMFAGCTKVETLQLGKISVANGGIVYPSNFKTSSVTDMSGMFLNCTALTSVTTLGWDLSKVTSMYRLFENCKSLTKAPVNGAAGVKDISNMFKNCSSLEEVGEGTAHKMTTDKVTDMTGAFQGCSSLTYVPALSSTAGVTSMNSMFSGCSKLKTFDLTNWNTANVTDMRFMFYNCSSADEINVCEFDASKLSNAASMFSGVPGKCYIYIASDATKIVNVCSESSFPNRVLITPSAVFVLEVGSAHELMFYGKRTTLKKGDRCNIVPYDNYVIKDVFNGYEIQNRTEATFKKNRMWNDYSLTTTKAVFHSTFSSVKVMNAYGYFRDMVKLTTIEGMDNLDLSKAKDLTEMFYNCGSLAAVKGTLNLDNATKTVRMFTDCKSLKSMEFLRWGTDDKLTDMSYMCQGCSSLVTFCSSSYYYPHTANVTSMKRMFNGCSSLVTVPTANMNTSKVTDMESMFYNCSKLSDATLKGLKNFNTKQVTNMNSMLYGLNASELDFSSWNTGNVTDMSGWLAKNTELRKLTLGTNFDLGKLEKYKVTSAFANNHDMTVITPKAKLSSIKTAFTSKLGFVIGSHGVIDDDTPKEVAQVIWTKGNTTLTFYYGNPVGSTFNNQTVTQKWSGDDVLSNTSESAKWSSTVKNDVTTVTFDKTFSNARPTSTKGWFWGCSKLKTINGLENLTTCYSVTDMSYMFYGCSALTELVFDNSLPRWTMDKVTTMAYMFYNCSSLKKLVLTRFNGTSKVTSMRSAFSNLSALESLDVSMVKTAAVTNADYLFNYDSKLRTLTVGSDFTFSKLSSKATNAFSNVSKVEVTATSTVLTTVQPAMKNKLGFIEKVDGVNGEFVASDKKTMQAIWTSSNKTLTFFHGKQYKQGGTFNGKTITNVWTVSANGGAPWLETVKSSVTTVNIDETMANHTLYSLKGWFNGCSALTTVNGLKNLSTSYTKDYSYMFYKCSALTTADVSQFMTKWSGTSSYSINLYCMFGDCHKLATIDVSKWSPDILSHVTDMAFLFFNCKAVSKLDVSKWNTSKVTTMKSMFSGCANLQTPDMSKWNTMNVKDMASMFWGCKKASPNCGSFDTGNVEDMSYMFYEAAGGTPSKDVSKVKKMAYMFYKNSTAAASANLANWNTANVTDMSYMFFDCQKAKRLYVSKWNVSKVTNMSYMFASCRALVEFGEWTSATGWPSLEKWKTTALTNMSNMFFYCIALESLNLSGFNLSQVTTMESCFSSCFKLRELDLRLSSSTSTPSKLSNAKNMFNSVGKNLTSTTPDRIYLNRYFKITKSMTDACNSFTKVFYVNDCDSGTNKTDMVKTLKNLGAAKVNNKIIWYNDSDSRKGTVKITE